MSIKCTMFQNITSLNSAFSRMLSKCCSISGVTAGWWWRWWDSSTYTPQDSKHYTRVHATPLEPNTRIHITETWELSGTKVKTSVVSFSTTSDEFTCGLNQRPDQLGEQPSCLQGQNNKRCVNLTGWLSYSLLLSSSSDRLSRVGPSCAMLSTLAHIC